jgi:CDP-glycerol glycerophosphotransferase (TagB/SpsB family)
MLLLAMGTDDKLPRGWLPSKLFEYLALDRPILAYVSEGEASDMVRKVNQGCVVTGQDHNQIIDFMNELYVSKWRHENLYVPWENDSKCKQRIQQPYLMKKLGTLLDGIAS